MSPGELRSSAPQLLPVLLRSLGSGAAAFTSAEGGSRGMSLAGELASEILGNGKHASSDTEGVLVRPAVVLCCAGWRMWGTNSERKGISTNGPNSDEPSFPSSIP
jgi:hypothetical protein